MSSLSKLVFSLLCIGSITLVAQNIGDFTSVFPDLQTDQFVFPSSHSFQKIVEVGDILTEGGVMPTRPDFTGFVPILNSSTLGYLSVNSEADPGGNTILDINFNQTSNLWEITKSQALDFTSVFGTRTNCSGTVTPWNTVISCEETPSILDDNLDGYHDFGWNIEINPETKTVIRKLWAMGNIAHENVSIHSNRRTVYQGSDSNPGYLYKFVANSPEDLGSGLLYVYSGLKNGAGSWILIQNTTQEDKNTTLIQSANLGGTVFNGVEDVEIGPDGMVYFAVKGERLVYRLQDSDALIGTTATMETFVGNSSYTIVHESGTSAINWGGGNDNLAFDAQGNLWVFQDGDRHYIWVVESGHTQADPKVKLFGIAPEGSEPTGITFTPDYKYLFMSIQHPSSINNADQTDAAGNTVLFSKGTVLVIALEGNLGETLSLSSTDMLSNTIRAYPNPSQSLTEVIIKGKNINNVKLFSIAGQLLHEQSYNNLSKITVDLEIINKGLYLFQINNEQIIKMIIK